MATLSQKTPITTNSIRAVNPGAPETHPSAKGNDDLVVLVNADGIVTYASPTILPMLGYTPEAVVGSHLSMLAHPDDGDALRSLVGTVAQTPHKALKAACRLRAKDGAACRVQGTATNLLQAPGVSAIAVHFRPASQRKRASRSNGRITRLGEHFVQFYETDAFLLDALHGYIETGLNAGEACIIVATQAHREQLEARLQASGLNLAAAQMQNTYLSLDAGETLGQFMMDDSPMPARFNALLEPVITRAAQQHRHVRAFGEMVALLWAAGNQAAAIRLEELWNDLARSTPPFSLFCAYAMPDFAGAENEALFHEICRQHARVIPAESYAALSRPDERLRAISELQQKANSLQAETAERQAAEERTFEALAALLELTRSLAWAQQEAEPPSMRTFAPQLAELARRALGCMSAALTLCDADTEALETLAVTGIPLDQSRRWHALLNCTHLQDALAPEAIAALQAGASTFVDLTPSASQAAFPKKVTGLVAPMRIADRLVGWLVYAHSPGAHAFTAQERHLAEAVAQLAAVVLEREHWLAERTATQAQLLALEETARQMEAFVGVVSHELRTPVTALKSSIQLARRRIAQESADKEAQRLSTTALLERTENQMRRLTRLIDNLVDLARNRSGELEMHVTVCDLGQVVREQVESERLVHPNRLIHFEPPHAPLLVRGDPDRLGQVVLNYLTNALKYAPADRPITVGIQQRGSDVQVRVQDLGPGIPAEEQQHIWDMFHRVPGIEVQSGSGIGLGLGLHISKVMVERQGGQVGVESAPGQGSTFWFTLPLASPEHPSDSR